MDKLTLATLTTMSYVESNTDFSFANSDAAKLIREKYLINTAPEIEAAEADALAFFKPNEMGDIMIIMYHDLIENDEEEGPYSRTFANFEKDMRQLLEWGYQPITMTELVTGDFDLPLGMSPVVITFDDGHPSDIAFEEDGSLSKKSAVGIMESLANEFPKFRPTATFYLNGPQAFGDWDYDPQKIQYLLEHGYEIGNHTSNHENLSEISLDEAREEILSQARRLETYTKSKTFNFALPFGEKFDKYEETLRSGWLGDYHMLSSVNVGWSPVPSFYSKDFNRLNLNRITCGEDDYELSYWMEQLNESPSRYISDGNKYVLTIPESASHDVDEEKIENLGMKVILYNEEYEIIKN